MLGHKENIETDKKRENVGIGCTVEIIGCDYRRTPLPRCLGKSPIFSHSSLSRASLFEASGILSQDHQNSEQKEKILI